MEYGMSNSMSKADELISKIFSEIGDSSQEANKTFSVWREVLLSIKSPKIDGSQLADHSRIIDFKNNILNELSKTNFNDTLYLKIVTDDKYKQEQFCEYLGCEIEIEFKNKLIQNDL
jgi:hypothetical protein